MQAAQASTAWKGQVTGFPFPAAFGNPIVANRGFQGEFLERPEGEFEAASEKKRGIREF